MTDTLYRSPGQTILEMPYLFEAPLPPSSDWDQESPAPGVGPGRIVPIFIIPGIMGTRLHDPKTGTYVWNPTAIPIIQRGNGTFAANVARLENPAELAPIPRHDMPPRKADFAKAQRVANFGHLIPDFYDLLAFDLSAPRFDAVMRQRHGATIRVIALGYDWRKDNRRSALRVMAEMRRHMIRLGAEKCIIVAHSMGGLVARWLCRHLRGEPFVQALFLIGSPTHGAPQGYRLLKRGRILGRDLRDLIPLFPATTEARFIRMLRGFASTYQLLPTRRYCASHPDWLDFSRVQAPNLPRDARNPDAIYHHPQLGFFDQFSRNPDRTETIRKHLVRRRQFDDGLGCYMPPRTRIIYGDGPPAALRTESRYQLRGNARSGVALTVSAETVGDGTVPAFSAAAQGCRLAFPALPAGSIGHAALPNDPNVRRILISAVAATVAGMGGVPRPPAPRPRPLVASRR